MKKMNEELEVVQGVAPQDIGTADVTGAYLPMSGANQILATLTTESLLAASTATIEILQATDDSGSGASVLVAPVTGTAPVGNGEITISVGVKSDDFDTNNGFAYYAVKVTCSVATTVGAVTVARGHLRYSV